MAQQHTRLLWLAGISASMLLHGLAIVACLWTPSYDFAPPAQAAPIRVNLVAATVASAKAIDPAEVGEKQPQSAAQVAAVAVKEPKKQPPKPQPDTPITASEAPATLVAQTTTKPKKSDEQPEPNEPEPDTVEEAPTEQTPTETSPVDRDNSVEQIAKAQPNLDVNQMDESLSSPEVGQLSLQQSQAKLSWQQQLHAKLEQAKRYPRQAKRLRKKGVAVVRFTMDREGNVLFATLMRSSGTSSLDEEATALVYRAQPLPRPPKQISGNSLRLTVPISFSF